MNYELNTLSEPGPRGPGTLHSKRKMIFQISRPSTLSEKRRIFINVVFTHTALMTGPRGPGTLYSKRKMIFQILRPSTLSEKRRIFINVIFTCHIYTALMTRPREPGTRKKSSHSQPLGLQKLSIPLLYPCSLHDLAPGAGYYSK